MNYIISLLWLLIKSKVNQMISLSKAIVKIKRREDISVLTESLPFGLASPVKLGRFCDFTKTVGFLGIKLPQINLQPEALQRVPQDREYSLMMVKLVQLLLQTKITLN